MSERLRNTLNDLHDDVEIEPITGGHPPADRRLAVLPEHGRRFVEAAYDDRTRERLSLAQLALRWWAENLGLPHPPQVREQPRRG